MEMPVADDGFNGFMNAEAIVTIESPLDIFEYTTAAVAMDIESVVGMKFANQTNLAICSAISKLSAPCPCRAIVLPACTVS